MHPASHSEDLENKQTKQTNKTNKHRKSQIFAVDLHYHCNILTLAWKRFTFQAQNKFKLKHFFTPLSCPFEINIVTACSIYGSCFKVFLPHKREPSDPSYLHFIPPQQKKKKIMVISVRSEIQPAPSKHN